MKTLGAGLATHVTGEETTLAHALRITRLDDEIFGFTSNPRDDTIDGLIYDASQGLDVTSIATSLGLAVDNLQLTTLNDSTLFEEADVFNGVWDNAAFVLFRYNYENISNGLDYQLAGMFGEANIRNGAVMAELRGLQQFYQQSVGRYFTKNCSWRLGVNDGILSRCPIDLPSLTVTGTLNSVTSNQVFRDSTRSEAADYFGEGVFKFTDGLNAGVSRRIKSYSADGTFTLDRPMYRSVGGTETYTAKPGCRKRFAEDCIAKFDVEDSFGGFPHAPGRNALMQFAVPSV